MSTEKIETETVETETIETEHESTEKSLSKPSSTNTMEDDTRTIQVMTEQPSPVRSVATNLNEIQVSQHTLSKKSANQKQVVIEEHEIPEEYQKIIEKKERELRNEFEQTLEKEMKLLKQHFDFILHNEQVRSSYMLQEAHRERQEKINALMTQLECKNLAGLMYVMCTERKKSKMENLRLRTEYTKYIHALQDILAEGQALILRLSRGYKSAAKVEEEWREKMKSVLKQSFIYHYTGGTPETTQYLLDVPKLMSTEAPMEMNLLDDPCIDEEVTEEERQRDAEEEEEAKLWHNRLGEEDSPFVMFGDFSNVHPTKRREVLNTLNADKTAPRKWKEYVFNEMFLKRNCENADAIKDVYINQCPRPLCPAAAGRSTHTQYEEISPDESRRFTTTAPTNSFDHQYGMGSILKMMSHQRASQSCKSMLLAARDSFEIHSSIKVMRSHGKKPEREFKAPTVVLDVKNRRQSMLAEEEELTVNEEGELETESSENQTTIRDLEYIEGVDPELGLEAKDSLSILSRVSQYQHHTKQDIPLNLEKVCPMDECKKKAVDSFIESLPSYMKASPFLHFERTFDEYETCSPEQLKILIDRISNDKKVYKDDVHVDLFGEWMQRNGTEGVATQTSEIEMSLPPCTCRDPIPTPASSDLKIYNVNDFFPELKQPDNIQFEDFFNKDINFHKFSLIGQDSNERMNAEHNFNKSRIDELTNILEKNPSMLDLFQGNQRG